MWVFVVFRATHPACAVARSGPPARSRSGKQACSSPGQVPTDSLLVQVSTVQFSHAKPHGLREVHKKKFHDTACHADSSPRPVRFRRTRELHQDLGHLDLTTSQFHLSLHTHRHHETCALGCIRGHSSFAISTKVGNSRGHLAL